MARNGRTLVFEVVEGVRRGAMVDEGVVEQMRHDCASQLTVEGGVGSEARLLECGPQDIAVLFGNRGESWDFGRVVEDIDRGVETQLFEPGLDFGYEGVAGALAAGALAVLFAEHDSHEIEVASGVLWQDDGEDSVHVLIYPKTDNLSSVLVRLVEVFEAEPRELFEGLLVAGVGDGIEDGGGGTPQHPFRGGDWKSGAVGSVVHLLPFASHETIAREAEMLIVFGVVGLEIATQTFADVLPHNFKSIPHDFHLGKGEVGVLGGFIEVVMIATAGWSDEKQRAEADEQTNDE